ncbi:MAG: 4Fe-4S dicluster domain-containing protein [Anaerolineae bacterium]|nr:4Fe-4S dicluster domain-containing protein [Anaerolineae bacterium]
MVKHFKNGDKFEKSEIECERQALAGDFCRGCGYCLPCPVEIPINNAAQMAFSLGRSPSVRWRFPEWQSQMKRIDDCLACRQYAERCPYGLDTPVLLKKMYADYKTFLQSM